MLFNKIRQFKNIEQQSQFWIWLIDEQFLNYYKYMFLNDLRKH